MLPGRFRNTLRVAWLLVALTSIVVIATLSSAQGDETHPGVQVARAVCGPACRSAPPIPVGITARLSERSDSDLAQVISQLRSAGVTYVKEDVSWATLEPRRGVYDWSSMDRWMAEAAKQGLEVIALPWSAPGWATSAWNVAPANGGAALADFSDFVRNLVERYGTNGSFWLENPELPAVPIRYYDIWNEPYLSRFWARDFPDPAGYARMFKAVVEAARPVDPGARFLLEANTRVIEGGNPGKPFLAAMFNAVPDLSDYAYAVSVHPYQGDGGSPRECSRSTPSAGIKGDWRATAMEFCRITDIRRILDANGAGRVKIWITEIGWSSAPRARNSVRKSTQASYVHQVFDLLRTTYRGMVSGLVWYEYQGSETNPRLEDGYYGLVDPDGRPKPAWHAFADEARRGL